MRSLAIIGAGGFVGTRLIETLVLRGVRGCCGVVRSHSGFARLCRFGAFADVRLADATRTADLVPAIRGFPVVVNVVSGDAKSISKSTKAIYEACCKAGVKRLIHTSSAAVFGMVESPAITDDSAPIRGLWSPYAKAKAESEAFLRRASGSGQPEIAVLRPGIVWGPRSSWSISLARDLAGRTAYLAGNGQGICNSIYVDNLVACILACAWHEGDSSGFFNVSDNETVTWKDFYASLAAGGERDMDHVWRIPGDRFRPSLRTRIDAITYSPVYEVVKNRIPRHMRTLLKAWLKARIEKAAGGSPLQEGGRQAPMVSREMWELQSTRRKLPNSKFAARFTWSPPVTFPEGVAKTVNWLVSAGMIPPTTS